MKAVILYSIKNILRNNWKKSLLFLIMFVEAIFIYSIDGFNLESTESLSPILIIGLFVAILIISSGIIHMDYKKGFLDILFSKPISKINYIFSKYIGLIVVIIAWDILNIIYINLISRVLSDSKLSLAYSLESFMFHLVDILIIPFLIILISTLVAKGVDLLIFYAIIVFGGILSTTNTIIPQWFVQYFLSMRFSKNLFNLVNGIDENWFLFYLSTSIIFALSAFFSIFILKRKEEN